MGTYRITLHVRKNSTAVIEESIMVSDICTDNDCRNNKAGGMNMKKSKAKYIISVFILEVGPVKVASQGKEWPLVVVSVHVSNESRKYSNPS